VDRSFQLSQRSNSFGRETSPKQKDRVIPRKKLSVVFQHNQIEIGNLGIGRVSVLYIGGPIDERLVAERMINSNDALRIQPIFSGKSTPTVATVKEFMCESEF